MSIIPKSTFINRSDISVKDFGAVGDGVTDDLSAFNSAISSAISSNVTLTIPQGTYKLSSTITIFGNIKMVGDGHETILSFGNINSYGFLLLGLTEGHFSNFKIAGTSSRAIQALECSQLKFDKLEVTGGVGDIAHASGFSMQGSEFTISDCYVHSNGNPASYNSGVSGIEILGEAGSSFIYVSTGTSSQTIDGTRTKIAQKFITSDYKGLVGFTMKLSSNSSFACSVRIETDSGGSPSGTLANVNLINSSFSPTSTSVSTGTFNSFAIVPSGTYWLVFTRTAGSATFDGGTTGNANQVQSNNGSWSSEPTIQNLYCTIDSSVNRGIVRHNKVICSTTDFAILIFNATGCLIEGNDINQGNILGPSPDDDSSGYGIAMYDANLHMEQNRIIGNTINNTAGSGIYYQGIGTFSQIDSPRPGPSIVGNTIINTCQQQSDFGLLVGAIAVNAPGASISGNVIYNTGPQGSGITWQGRGTVIGANYINGVISRAALYMRSGFGQHDCAGSSIGATVVANSILGLRSAGSTIDNLSVKGLNIREGMSGSLGIYLHSATNCDIDANVSGQSQQGIVIATENADSKNNKVTGIVQGNGLAIANAYPGILTQGDHDLVYSARSYGVNQQYGIQCTGNYAKVIGCDTTGNFGTTIAIGSNGASLPQGTINVVATAGFAASGSIFVVSSAGLQVIAYTGVTSTSFTGCTGGTGTLTTNNAVYAVANSILATGTNSLVATSMTDESGVIQNATNNINANVLSLYDSTGTQKWLNLSYIDKAIELPTNGTFLGISAVSSGQSIAVSSDSDVTLKTANGAIILEADGGSHQSVFRSATGSGGNGIIINHPNNGACALNTSGSSSSFAINVNGVSKFSATSSQTTLNSPSGQITSIQGDTVKFTLADGTGTTCSITFDGVSYAVIAGGSVGGIKLQGIAGGTGDLVFNSANVIYQSTNMTIDASETSFTIFQANKTTNSGIGANLTIQAQNETGTTSTGGNLVLLPGTGTSIQGKVLVGAVGDSTHTNLRINGTVQSTVGAAGAATILPVNPTNYILININGTDFAIPYYAAT